MERPIGGELHVGARPPLDLVVIGAGFSGTSLLNKLIEEAPPASAIRATFIDGAKAPGAGHPYGEGNHASYLLNTPARAIWLDLSRQNEFLTWVMHNPSALQAESTALVGLAGAFLPRRTFGRFLEEAFAERRRRAATRGVTVDVIQGAAAAIELGAPRVEVRLADGRKVEGDEAVLTTGHWTSTELRSLARHPLASTGEITVIERHIPGHEIDRLPLDAEVTVLGSALSALDVVQRLFAPETGARFIPGEGGMLTFVPGGNERRVTLCSRSGKLPKVKPEEFEWVAPRQFTRERIEDLGRRGELSAAALGTLLLAELSAHGVRPDVQALRSPYDGLTGAQITERARSILEGDLAAARRGQNDDLSVLSQRLLLSAAKVVMDLVESEELSPADRLQVQQFFGTFVQPFASACPRPTAERVLALMRAGRLTVIAGAQAPAVDTDARAVRIAYAVPGGESGAHVTRHLIGAAGLGERRAEMIPDRLIAGLVQQGALSPMIRDGLDLGGVDVDPETAHAIGRDGRATRRIRIIGEATQGRMLFTGRTTLLEQQTARAARDIVQPGPRAPAPARAARDRAPGRSKDPGQQTVIGDHR